MIKLRRSVRQRRNPAVLVILCVLLPTLVGADGDLPTKFTNLNSIINTRHNLTQSTLGVGVSGKMDPYRNDYGEVCVYCHTPHQASGTVGAPLWNRTATSATFTTYDQLGTSSLTQTVTAPGVNSLTCLSCHDGTVAVDSIINMPNQTGAQNYLPAQETSVNLGFLNSWTNAGTDAGSHFGLASPGSECLGCHAPLAVAPLGSGAPDFSAFNIGADLTNDHPIGITFPLASVDFNVPGTVSADGNMRFFDGDGDSRADSDEIRIYDTGQGFEVECASCHDPHGVDGGGGSLITRFLRKANTNSDVCLTCHIK